MKARLLLLFVFLAATRLLAQAAATPDDTAKFLAGLPVRGTPLEALSGNPAWVEHAMEFDKAWRSLEARQLSKIRTWSSEFLASPSADKGPMCYFFSGPDILYAQAFFPHSSIYVLAGLEPVGIPPDVLQIPPGALSSALANLRKSLNSVLSFSFFITKDMKVDLQQNQLSGTLPILYVFLARAGCKIDTVELIWLDRTGSFSRAQTLTPGVRITFFGPGGAQQMLYYFATDLSNDGIKRQPGFTKFCEHLDPERSLLKATSYLMHRGEFTTVRNFLLKHSATIVQDDSGIPLKYFDPSRWVVRYFGNYPGPIDFFKQNYQPDLAAIYKTSHPPALHFGFGYRWHPSQSTLIVATPKSTANIEFTPTAIPITTP
jgi:hypothetical protein